MIHQILIHDPMSQHDPPSCALVRLGLRRLCSVQRLAPVLQKSPSLWRAEHPHPLLAGGGWGERRDRDLPYPLHPRGAVAPIGVKMAIWFTASIHVLF